MVNVYFSYEHLNLMMLLIAVVIGLYLLSLKTNKKRVLLFGNYETLEKVMGKPLIQKKYLLLATRLIALILIILGLSNFTVVLVKQISTTDIVFAIDTSSSMLTPDFEPSRLDVAKKILLKTLDKIPKETKIGIVTFAGKGYEKLGLTTDRTKIKDTIMLIESETPAGTAITDALSIGGIILSNSKRKKLIILITDGRNNVGLPVNTTIDYLQRNNITIHTIGLGTINETENITDKNISAGKLGNATEAMFPNLDVESLKFLSNETNGKFFLATNEKELETAMNSIETKNSEDELNISFFMMLIGLSMLLVEWGLSIFKYESIP